MMKKLLLVGTFIIAVLTSSAYADVGDKKVTKQSKKIPVVQTVDEKNWSVEIGSGALFSNVRVDSNDNMDLVPLNVTLAYKLDKLSLKNSWAAGYTELLARSDNYFIVKGIESRMNGLSFGPRYNFVQKDWLVVPYVQGLVGFGFGDSHARSNDNDGIGQDFNLSFGVGAGVRYDINKDWFVRLGVEYTHFSNAGLGFPKQNNAVDAVGPVASVGYKF